MSIKEISAAVQAFNPKTAVALVRQAIAEGCSAQEILEQGLLDGMSAVGIRFRDGEVFIPEVLMAARAMNKSVEILKPYLASEGVEKKGTAVIGTVRGDMHDIGKNLVKMMMEGKGIEVIDLGINVDPERFAQAAKENNARIVCCSALLTTTMEEMKNVVEEVKKAGIRQDVKIFVGGAPVTEAFCKSIGADVFTSDAASAAIEAEKVFASA